MLDGEDLLRKRIEELAEKSYRNNQYMFTNFLSPAEYDVCAQALQRHKYIKYDSFGGTDVSERVMIRFGSEEDLGYVEDFPFVCIVIEPNLAKFADDLNHRDFLGSIMNLGIERNVIGDITIKENKGYVMCRREMADFVVDNLQKIKHTYVKCTIMEEMPAAILPTLQDSTLSVSSERCDIVIAKLYNISRNDSLNLFRGKKICINSRIEESNSRNLKEEDVISVRGYGKFIYHGVQSVNKKEKLRVAVSRYV